MKYEKIGVVGAGSWGTALGILLAGHGIPIALWGHKAAHIDAMKADGENKTYLPGVKLPSNIQPTSSLDDVADADLILIVTPSRATRGVMEKLAAAAPQEDAIFLSCSKGIEQGSGLRLSEIIAANFPGNTVAVLSGPSHAEEVSREMPTAMVIGCAQENIGIELQQAFSTKFFRAYTSDDVAGIELGGALKNVYAIATGMGDGMGLGDNAKAALVTRSLAELIRIGITLGGRRETFQGLSGIGDLMVTCFSRHSRNRGFGERLGKGETVADIQKSMTMIAEGVPTALSARERARTNALETPILDQVYAVLYENKSPREAMHHLLTRDPRPEVD